MKKFNMHKDANKVIAYMKSLGMPEEIIERAWLEMWETAFWVNDDYHQKGYIKTNSTDFIKSI